mmetsp:Transcript_1525/g.5226  ORF Transcript_1525/g.5226 Transcript_1525/m.5226 type:complete len:523 (-) Transcript_1525:1300-2868(-)|eukprot:CAMPEP_0117448538 /NCGR_PEP_ID=MMETSP0759-20121206/7453_1 /TAXON_ID=63605 /ORGANISM="Percolomonas cosmopolitus, Strain WS" /LENGTH=522 /DNA_ID=CAMNT_0005240929 /DNA_START=162 /DNA_END=1730 /DNA_ORIENTATION=+
MNPGTNELSKVNGVFEATMMDDTSTTEKLQSHTHEDHQPQILDLNSFATDLTVSDNVCAEDSKDDTDQASTSPAAAANTTTTKKSRSKRSKKNKSPSDNTPRKFPKWTDEDDKKLKAAVLLHNEKNWKEIAKMMDNRYTETQCLNRYKKVLNPNVVKGPWTEEEDQKLMQLVKLHGAKKWSMIAIKIPGRISKQCRERWVNSLNPEINRGPWTKEEDKIIEDSHATYGNKWSKIVAVLRENGYIRTDNGVKNHWNSTMRRERERRQLIEKGLQPGKRRKYSIRKVSLTTAEPLTKKTPKKKMSYPQIVVLRPTESDQDLAAHQRTQQETLNGLLVPRESTTNADYVSTVWDPSIESDFELSSQQQERSEVEGGTPEGGTPHTLPEHTNNNSIENATYFIPPILKPNKSNKRKRAANDQAQQEIKKRRVSSSGQLEAKENAKQSEQGNGDDATILSPAFIQTPQSDVALTESFSPSNTLSLCLSRLLPSKLRVDKTIAYKHPIFASAAHLIAQRRTMQEVAKK